MASSKTFGDEHAHVLRWNCCRLALELLHHPRLLGPHPHLRVWHSAPHQPQHRVRSLRRSGLCVLSCLGQSSHHHVQDRHALVAPAPPRSLVVLEQLDSGVLLPSVSGQNRHSAPRRLLRLVPPTLLRSRSGALRLLQRLGARRRPLRRSARQRRPHLPRHLARLPEPRPSVLVASGRRQRPHLGVVSAQQCPQWVPATHRSRSPKSRIQTRPQGSAWR
jgi:hypothetical protein